MSSASCFWSSAGSIDVGCTSGCSGWFCVLFSGSGFMFSGLGSGFLGSGGFYTFFSWFFDLVMCYDALAGEEGLRRVLCPDSLRLQDGRRLRFSLRHVYIVIDL